MKAALSNFHSWLLCVMFTDRLGIDKQAPQNALYMYAYMCTYEHMDERNHTHPYTYTHSCQFIRYLTNTSLKQLQQKNKNCIASFMKVEFISGLLY